MKPVLHRSELRLVLVAAIALVVGLVSALLWYPRAVDTWGRGPGELGARAVAIARALGVRGAHQRPAVLHRAPDGPCWVSTWSSPERTTVVVLDPSGRLIGARQEPSMLAVDMPEDGLRGLVEGFGATLPPEVGRVAAPQGEDTSATLTRPDGCVLRVIAPRTGAASPLEIRGEHPLPAFRRPFRLPSTLAALAALSIVGIAIRLLWRTVNDGRANPSCAVWLGAVVAAAALVGHLARMAALGASAEGVLATVTLPAVMAVVVMAGHVLDASRASAMRARVGEERAGWLLGAAALGAASVSLLLPEATELGVAASRVTGMAALWSVLLGTACGLFVEGGLRPVMREALPSTMPYQRHAIVALVAGLAVAGVLPGPWWWALLWVILACIGSGVTEQRFGGAAATAVLAVFFAASIALPGLATSPVRGITSVLALALAYAFLPSFILRRSRPESGEGTYIPGYVQTLRDEAHRAHVEELAERLQVPLCAIAPAVDRGFDAACVARRARPPRSDFCRVVGITKERIGVVLGEVPGGGVDGSIQASVLSTAAVAVVSDAKNLGSLPGEVERVAGTVWSGDGETAFMCVGLLDGRSKTFSVVNAAGQGVLLHRALAGRFEHIGTVGDPLRVRGLEGKRVCEVTTVQLVTKDLLVFYSDGLLGVRHPEGRGLSPADLESLVLANPTASCAQLAHALEDRLGTLLAGKPPADDIVVLFLRGK